MKSNSLTGRPGETWGDLGTEEGGGRDSKVPGQRRASWRREALRPPLALGSVFRPLQGL